MKGKSTTMSTLIADVKIIERILAGEKQLFELLIRKHNQLLYRMGMSVLENEAETADAIQTSYIKAFEQLSGFSGHSQFSTWLIDIMLNQCLEKQRKTSYHLAENNESYNFIDMKPPANKSANPALSRILEKAIADLPEEYRLVFMLREIEDMSVHDTAEALCIEEASVKVRLTRARSLLRGNLKNYLKDHIYSLDLYRGDRVVNYVMKHLGIA